MTWLNNNLANVEGNLNTKIGFEKADVMNANNAPDGFCSLDKSATSNPYAFYCTLFTFTMPKNAKYKVQLALPFGSGEHSSLKYRVCDDGKWSSWADI